MRTTLRGQLAQARERPASAGRDTVCTRPREPSCSGCLPRPPQASGLIGPRGLGASWLPVPTHTCELLQASPGPRSCGASRPHPGTKVVPSIPELSLCTVSYRRGMLAPSGSVTHQIRYLEDTENGTCGHPESWPVAAQAGPCKRLHRACGVLWPRQAWQTRSSGGTVEGAWFRNPKRFYLPPCNPGALGTGRRA